MICTTLNKIREHGPCFNGWQKLLKHLGKTEADDEPLPLLTVLDSNGLDDAIWCLRAMPEHDVLWRHYAVDCAERFAHLLTDERSREALRVARRYAMGQATDAEMADAWADAGKAQKSIAEAKGAAEEAARRAAAKNASRDAVEAVWSASEAAVWEAIEAARRAGAKNAFSKEKVARAAEKAWQTARLRKLLTDGAWSPVEEA
jgi:hypothetical protein